MEVYWLEQTEADVPSGDDWLTSQESVRLSSMAFPKRRADWRLGRWTAKKAVHAFMPHHPFAEIEIRAHKTGRPEVWIDGRQGQVTISLSHRQGLACCALVEHRAALGCDLEYLEPHTPCFIADYFVEKEQAWIARAMRQHRQDLPSVLWSAKESALKALGVGLREDTRSVVVQEFDASLPSPAWRPFRVWHGEREFDGWCKAHDGFVRTLIADPPAETPRMCPQ